MTKTTKWLDLLINGKSRKAEAMKENDLYVVIVPAAELVDGSGTGESSPAVQGHSATFDKDGVLLGVDALGWNAEGGFYKTNWPTKADSVYNANAAKTYAPQVFKQVKKNGGWLAKYQLGGEAPQQTQTEDQQLLALVTSAYKEVASGKLGESFMYVALLLQDSQGAAKLDSLRTQIPELEEMLSAIEEVAFQQSAYMKRGGCAKKKKVKKGAKGCTPCKKLMKVGGKLINVLTDCEGRIVSKHATGGWLVPKGEGGLTAELIAMLNPALDLNWAKQQAASTSNNVAKTGKHYYKGANGIYEVEASRNLDGTYRWGDSRKLAESEYAGLGITKSGYVYTRNGALIGDIASLGQAYTIQVTPSGPILYTDGTNWYTANAVKGADGLYHWGEGVAANINDFGDDDMRTGLTRADLDAGTITRDLSTAAGIDISKFQKAPISKRGVTVDGGNTLLGTTGELDADKYLEMKGARGVYLNERNLYRKELRKLRSEKRFGYKNAWESRLDTDDKGNLNTANDKKRSDVTENFKTAKATLRLNFSNQAAHNVDAIFNKWNRISAGSYSPSLANENDRTNLEMIEGNGTKTKGQKTDLEVLTAKKAGGYLNKFN